MPENQRTETIRLAWGWTPWGPFVSAKDSEVGPGALRGAGWVPVLEGIGRPQP